MSEATYCEKREAPLDVYAHRSIRLEVVQFLYNGAADDDSITYMLKSLHLFCCRNAESDDNGNTAI